MLAICQRRCLHQSLPILTQVSCIPLDARWSKVFSTKDAPPGPTVSIDRSGLYSAPDHSHLLAQNKEAETELTKQLKALIRVGSSHISYPVVEPFVFFQNLPCH